MENFSLSEAGCFYKLGLQLTIGHSIVPEILLDLVENTVISITSPAKFQRYAEMFNFALSLATRTSNSQLSKKTGLTPAKIRGDRGDAKIHSKITSKIL